MFDPNGQAGFVSGYDGFLAQLRDRQFLRREMNVFRSFPLLLIDEQPVAILDLLFLSELLSQGVYWTIFDALPSTNRRRFKELWGKAFERYVGALFAHYYPPPSRILSMDIPYAGGQVDAMLDFGSLVILLEIKSSLLTESAKRSGVRDTLLADIERKYVRTEDGEAKGVLQLANACAAIRDGRLRTSYEQPRIYPVVLTDEVCAEAPGFNSYLNTKFFEVLSDQRGIKPLTVMSVGEVEEILPYIAAAQLTWEALFDRRFTPDGKGLLIHSVHQTLYDLSHTQGTPVLRNEFVLHRFENVYAHIKQVFQAPE